MTRAQTTQYLTFSVAGEEYAIDILRIREILEFGEVTVVPKAPAWLRGVINLRGAVVPIVDLSRKLGLGETEKTRLTCSIIIETVLGGDTAIVGLMAESVSQVIELSEDQIEPAPSFGTHLSTTFLLGMARSGEKFALLLDIDPLLASEDVAVLVPDAMVAGGEIAAETAGAV
jgi:purine-binding chemotaxis protein CheW